jgi:hypothetical protein
MVVMDRGWIGYGCLNENAMMSKQASVPIDCMQSLHQPNSQ